MIDTIRSISSVEGIRLCYEIRNQLDKLDELDRLAACAPPGDYEHLRQLNQAERDAERDGAEEFSTEPEQPDQFEDNIEVDHEQQ